MLFGRFLGVGRIANPSLSWLGGQAAFLYWRSGHVAFFAVLRTDYQFVLRTALRPGGSQAMVFE